jgi:NADH dehydrogenase
VTTDHAVRPTDGAQYSSRHIVIAGGGFAGVRLARLLARNGPRADARGRPVRVTLIDRNDAFTYTPLLYDVAAGKAAPDHVTTPYRDLLWDRSVVFVRAEITGFDLERRTMLTDRGAVPYDRLALALGAASTLPRGSNGSGLAAHAFPFMNLSDAEAIRARMIARFRAADERNHGDTTVVIAGGGAKGVELAFDLADFAERRLAPAFGIPPGEIRIVLVDGEGRLMPDLPSAFDRAARAAMQRRGIRLLHPAFVVGADDSHIRLDDTRTIAARTLIWTAGITAHPLVRALGVPLTDGALRVTASLQLPGHAGVYVAGDNVWGDDGTGARLPATASLAQQHGRFLARALAADLAGDSLPEFSHTPRGSIIKLGDGNAIAQLGAGPHAPCFSGPAAFALRGGFDLLEVPGIAQKRGTLRDLLRRMKQDRLARQ